MITAFSAYIKTIVALAIFSTLANMLMPENDFKKYVELVVGLLVLATVLTPLFKIFGISINDINYDSFEENKVNYTLDLEEKLLVNAYKVELTEKISLDLLQQNYNIINIDVEFINDTSNNNFGEISQISIEADLSDKYSFREFIANRYNIDIEKVSIY